MQPYWWQWPPTLPVTGVLALWQLVSCMSGPSPQYMYGWTDDGTIGPIGTLSDPMSTAECLAIFDTNSDGRIDLRVVATIIY